MTLDPIRRISPEDAGARPPDLHPSYKSTVKRAPSLPAIIVPQTITETSGAALDWMAIVGETVDDLTAQHQGEPIGQRIIVSGRVLDDLGRPVSGALVEIWQANAAGRYIHKGDDWNAPIDPNFTGMGRVVTDADGGYSFVTIRPGAYPWPNHENAWRPAHIHFSVFGDAIATRLITQMYFPDDPLLALDPIAAAVPEAAVKRMVATFDLETTRPAWALGYRFDIVLRSVDKNIDRSQASVPPPPTALGQTPAQTIGPFFHYCLPASGAADLVGNDAIGARPDLIPEGHNFLASPLGPASELAAAAAHYIINIAGHIYDADGVPLPDAMLEIWQADEDGNYPDTWAPGHNRPFTAFGRCATDAEGAFRFRTVRPGATQFADGDLQAPHVQLSLSARGLINIQTTRVYFLGDPHNDIDPVLMRVPQERRHTLVANPKDDVWVFDIHLQGADETVFFKC
jgi:protocatechuate 3,4-dioxygenase beta subunit